MKNNSFDFDYEKGVLTVPTPKGNIKVIVDTISAHPGVYIDFESEDTKEEALICGEDLMLAKFEYNTSDNELVGLLWENLKQEDYSYKANFNNMLNFDENKK